MSNRRINIVVTSPLRKNVEILFSDNMYLFKLMQAYADVCGLNRRNLTFRFRGLTILGTDTANLLNIRTGNTIEVTDKVPEKVPDKEKDEDEIADQDTDIQKYFNDLTTTTNNNDRF